jgi:hypothetical protein
MSALRSTYIQIRSMTQNGVKKKVLEANPRESPHGALRFWGPYIARTTGGVPPGRNRFTGCFIVVPRIGVMPSLSSGQLC